MPISGSRPCDGRPALTHTGQGPPAHRQIVTLEARQRILELRGAVRRRGARRGVQGGNGSQPRWIVDFFTQARPGRGRFARCGPGHAATCALVRGCVPEESPACVSRRTGGLARIILLSLKPFGRVSCLPRRAAPCRAAAAGRDAGRGGDGGVAGGAGRPPRRGQRRVRGQHVRRRTPRPPRRPAHPRRCAPPRSRVALFPISL